MNPDAVLLRVLSFLCSTSVKVVDEPLLRTLLKLDSVTVGKVLGVLLAGGYLREVSAGSLTACGSCPLSGSCPGSLPPESSIKVYVPTERLKKLCRELKVEGPT